MKIGSCLSLAAALFLGLTWGATRTMASPINGPILPSLSDPSITEADGWVDFSFGGPGSYDDQGAFTFSGPELLTVLDGYAPGDQFAVYDNGDLLGDTSSVSAASGDSCSDPNVCAADPNFSIGEFDLAGGSHSITIEAIASPWGAGGAFLEIAPALAGVPEPSGLLLLGAGLAGLFLAAKRRSLV